MTSQNDIYLIENFFNYLITERGFAKNSLASYMLDIQDFLAFAKISNRKLEDISSDDALKYFSSEKISKLKSSSISRKISCLKHLYDFLLSEKIIQDNPTDNLDRPAREELIPKSLSKENLMLLADYFNQLQCPEGIRSNCIFSFLYSSGMRISEVLSMKLQSISNPIETKDEYMLLSISGKGNKERLVILNHIALAALSKYLAVRANFLHKKTSDFLFPSLKKNGKISHLTRQMFFFILKNAAIALGIDPSIISPHKIRHSFASHMLENGANLRELQELLGHSNITSTQIYTRVLSKQAQDLLKQHPLAN